jgi:hypothetical protein
VPYYYPHTVFLVVTLEQLKIKQHQLQLKLSHFISAIVVLVALRAVS